MHEIMKKYNLERINYLKDNKSEITEETLDELRTLGLVGKQIAVDILELKSEESYSSIHLVELHKCLADVIYFKNNYIKIKTINGEVFTVNDDKNKLQDKMLKGIDSHSKVKITSDRQTRKSYAGSIYALWLFNFHLDKNICIAADKTIYCKQHISNITDMYNSMPNWMKAKSKNLKTSMTSENGSKIFIAQANEREFRGITLDMLIIENAATINTDKLRECLDSVICTMMYNEDYKIIVLEENSAISPDFYEVNENTELETLEAPVKTQRPILKRTLKEIIKHFIDSLYKRIRG